MNMPRVMSPRGMPTRMPGNPQVITFPVMTMPATPGMTNMGTPLANSMTLAQTSPFLNRLRLANRLGYGFGMNPYLNGATMGGGSSGYGASGGGSGGGSGSSGGYGGGGGYSNQPSSSNTADPYQTYASKYGSEDEAYSTAIAGYGGKSDQSKKTSEMGAILTAAGLPNKEGHLNWPLGLRLLRPDDETRDLRRQVDVLVQGIAFQQLSSQPNSAYVQQTEFALERLRLLAERERHSLSSGTYREVERFLAKLDRFLKDAGRS